MDNGGLTLETEAMLNHLSEVVMGSVFYRETMYQTPLELGILHSMFSLFYTCKKGLLNGV